MLAADYYPVSAQVKTS